MSDKHHECEQTDNQKPARAAVGEVVKLDRGFPLVKLDDGTLYRCIHAPALEKFSDMRAVIGDIVDVEIFDDNDKAVIIDIHPRTTVFIRKDPSQKTAKQVLAANFDRVIVVQTLNDVNLRRLERELVLAHETKAAVTVLLTKADLASDPSEIGAVCEKVQALAGRDVDVLAVSANDEASLNALRELIGTQTGVLFGRSGVGKSTLINALIGQDLLPTAQVREKDGKGRHTTVSREIIELPDGGRIIDMPGIRGLALWDADEGIEAAFADIESIAQHCRFRDCKHEQEPGCAVQAALAAGEITRERFDSYQSLKQETRSVKERREQARWMTSEQAPESKRNERIQAGIAQKSKRKPS